MSFKFNPFTGNFDQVNPPQDLSGYVPYVGATADLDLGDFFLQTSKILDGDGLDVFKTTNRQFIRPDGNAIFEFSANDLPTFKSNSNISGFYFEGGLTPYLQYDSISDVISTGNYGRFIFNVSYVSMPILEDTIGYTVIDTNNRYIQDSNGTRAGEFSSLQRQLFDFGGNYPSVDFGNYNLPDINVSNGAPMLGWGQNYSQSVKIWYSSSQILVADFGLGQLYAPGSGALVYDFNSYLAYDDYNSVSIDHNYHRLSTLGTEYFSWDGGIGFFGVSAVSQQSSSGAQTASGTYGATEQTMLQEAYDALRAYGLLT